MTCLPALFGPYGRDALAFADRLVEYGANAAWFHGFDGEAFDRCARHGLAACVEFPTFRADYAAHPELVPIGADGRPIRYGRLVQGVCLSQQAFLDEIEAQLLAGMQRYAPTGVWLDYLTYAGWFEVPQPDLQESCFCPACIAEFCAATGIDTETPAEILNGHLAAWRQHKCERIAGFAAHYAGIIRAQQPDCVVGAYMCPWTPEEFDGALGAIFGQDYALLAPSIDVFTPLIYAHKSGRRADWGATFLEQPPAFVPPGRKVQLILDALDFPASLEAVARSQRPTWGLQMFGGAEVFGERAKSAVFRESVLQVRRGLVLG